MSKLRRVYITRRRSDGWYEFGRRKRRVSSIWRESGCRPPGSTLGTVEDQVFEDGFLLTVSSEVFRRVFRLALPPGSLWCTDGRIQMIKCVCGRHRRELWLYRGANRCYGYALEVGRQAGSVISLCYDSLHDAVVVPEVEPEGRVRIAEVRLPGLRRLDRPALFPNIPTVAGSGRYYRYPGEWIQAAGTD